MRLGTPALTTRGFVEADFEKVADFVVRGIHRYDPKTKLGPKLKDYTGWARARGFGDRRAQGGG